MSARREGVNRAWLVELARRLEQQLAAERRAHANTLTVLRFLYDCASNHVGFDVGALSMARSCIASLAPDPEDG